MKIWIDAQLPPSLAEWINSNFDITATSLKELSLRDAKDINAVPTGRSDRVSILAVEQLEALGEALLDFSGGADLERWFSENS